MKNLAIITARGGSKRIPKKNIKEFCGKPIIAYSIEAAVKSGLFDEVMVSTDSEEIADISKQFGAVIPFFRSAETSNDFAGTADVLNEVVSEYTKRGRTFDYMCCIYPTAPFVTAEKLIDAYNKLTESEEYNAISPVVAFSYPPQRGIFLKDEQWVIADPKSWPCRSQDLETMYHDVGQFYFYNMKYWGVGGGKRRTLIYPESEVQDIDNFEDWKIAEAKYRLMVESLEK